MHQPISLLCGKNLCCIWKQISNFHLQRCQFVYKKSPSLNNKLKWTRREQDARVTVTWHMQGQWALGPMQSTLHFARAHQSKKQLKSFNWSWKIKSWLYSSLDQPNWCIIALIQKSKSLGKSSVDWTLSF